MKTLILFCTLFVGCLITYGQDTYVKGDKIEGNWRGNGRWYPGTIEEVKGDQYFIKYNDGDTEWTTANFIRKKGETKISWPTNTHSDKTTKFNKGDKIDIDYNGKWYDGTVLAAKDGQYLVHYEGWSDGYDEIINNGRIRARTEKDKPTTPENMSGNNGSSSSSSSGVQTREITLENTCTYYSTMFVNDKEYELRPSQKVEVDCKDGDEIYYEKNGRKILLGTVAINGSLWWYHPQCD